MQLIAISGQLHHVRSYLIKPSFLLNFEMVHLLNFETVIDIHGEGFSRKL